MNDCELISYVTAIACGIIKCLPDDELELLAAILTQLGDTIATYLAQQNLKESRTQNKNNSNDVCN